MATIPVFSLQPQPDDELGHTFRLNWDAIDKALARRRGRNAWTFKQRHMEGRLIDRNGGHHQGPPAAMEWRRG